MRRLTPKEKQWTDLVLAGNTNIEATKKVYKCKNDNVARVLSSKVFNREEVNKRLTIIEKKQVDAIRAKLPEKWEQILTAEVKEGGISYDSLIKGLSYLSDKTLFNKEKEQAKAIQIGNKYIKNNFINAYLKQEPKQEGEPTGELQETTNIDTN